MTTKNLRRKIKKIMDDYDPTQSKLDIEGNEELRKKLVDKMLNLILEDKSK